MEESRQVFNSVIKKVLRLKEQFCSCTNDEYMIAPDQVSTVCTLEVCKCTFYSMEGLALSVLNKGKMTGIDSFALDIREILGLSVFAGHNPFLSECTSSYLLLVYI